jgi:hypothetical protein
MYPKKSLGSKPKGLQGFKTQAIVNLEPNVVTWPILNHSVAVILFKITKQ